MEELYDAKCREGEVGNTFNESNSHEQLVYFSTRVSVACILRLVRVVSHIL